MKLRNFISLAILLIFFVQHSTAQRGVNYFRVGVGAGAMHYQGEIAGSVENLRYTRPGFEIMGAYHFNSLMSLRLGLLQGWIASADESSNLASLQQRNLSFRSSITEFSFQFVLDLVPTRRNYTYRPRFTPYVFWGMGLFRFNPQAERDGIWIDLQPLGTEGQFLPSPENEYPEPYALTQFNLPFGVGLKFAMGQYWNLELSTGFRLVFTDYLDDVSGFYPDLDALRRQNPVAAQMSDPRDLERFPTPARAGDIRGNPRNNDWYIYTAVTFSYIIDWVKCPSFR